MKEEVTSTGHERSQQMRSLKSPFHLLGTAWHSRFLELPKVFPKSIVVAESVFSESRSRLKAILDPRGQQENGEGKHRQVAVRKFLILTTVVG